MSNPEIRLHCKAGLHKTVQTYRSERSMADTLRSLAVRLSRLSPSHSDPERYHVEKSELVYALRRLARRLPKDQA